MKKVDRLLERLLEKLFTFLLKEIEQEWEHDKKKHAILCAQNSHDFPDCDCEQQPCPEIACRWCRKSRKELV